MIGTSIIVTNNKRDNHPDQAGYDVGVLFLLSLETLLAEVLLSVPNRLMIYQLEKLIFEYTEVK